MTYLIVLAPVEVPVHQVLQILRGWNPDERAKRSKWEVEVDVIE